MPVVVNAMLGVIMMTRIHAMYQRSKKIFIFLVTVFLTSTIATGVMTGIGIGHASGGEGAYPFRHPSVFFRPSCGRPTSDFRNLDTSLYMGDLAFTFANCDNH
ncbi:hypothetical protein DFH29DRAFT_958927 [Suillus ampliporus]|nr:hypothetical protein DFH29DRAFT_958927 [Suillus ampliporus]